MTTLTPAGRFRHRVGTHPASGALRDLLEHHGLSYGPEPLSEGAVFGLSGALALRVRAAMCAVPALDLLGRTAWPEADLCRHLGLAAQLERTDDPAAAAARLLALLQDGRPVLLRVDAAQLPYAPPGAHDTRHVVTALECDEDAGVVLLADPRFCETRTCSVDALARARGANAWPERARHALLALGDEARLADPRDAVDAALAHTVRTMREPDFEPHPHIHDGLAAADVLADAWSDLPALAGRALGDTLACVRARIADPGTGGSLHRSQQARFEHDAAALLGCPALGRAALVCDELADAWRGLTGALGDPGARHAHTVACAWVQRIHGLEHRHVEALETSLAALG